MGGEKEIELKVEGIVCAGCAMDAEGLLRKTDGVLGAAVSFAEETIRVRYDPEMIDEKKIIFTVMKLGFKVKTDRPSS